MSLYSSDSGLGAMSASSAAPIRRGNQNKAAMLPKNPRSQSSRNLPRSGFSGWISPAGLHPPISVFSFSISRRRTSADTAGEAVRRLRHGVDERSQRAVSRTSGEARLRGLFQEIVAVGYRNSAPS